MAFLLTALAPCQLMPAPAAAQALPPDHPTVAFSAEYRLERDNGGWFAWGRRRLFVEDGKVRDELLDGDLDPATTITDGPSGKMLVFDPEDPDRQARRTGLGPALPSMARGYRAVAERLGPPKLAGERQIAGQSCTRLLWETSAERQEWCVTAQGIALSAWRHANTQESRSEALTLDLDPPDPAVFELPAGFTAHGD